MSQNLIVVGFHGTHRASEVLGRLVKLTDEWAIELKDAVAVHRTDAGWLRTDQSVQPTTKQGAGLGAVIGGLIGALLAAPLTAGASVAAAATTLGFGTAAMGAFGSAVGAEDAAKLKNDYGISDEFVRQVSGMIAPGDSAVFAVLSGGKPDKIAEQFRGYGGTILRTTLSPLAAARVQRALNG